MKKTTHPVTRAALGVAALVTIAILANWLVSLTPVATRGADFTENQNHTLSDGTRAIVRELDTPVVIRYYATRSTDYMPEQIKLHMRRVDDLLKEYASLSDKLRIEDLDPQPDTDAEDSANLDGLSGQRIDDQNIFFGLAITALDRKQVIPFLDPGDETMLEYHLSKAIAEVSTPVKPVIGIMSALELAPSMPMMQGQQPSQGWIMYQQLSQAFELRDLTMTPESIDPKEIKALLLFHPADITPQAEYAIDQYLLGGGTVVACLDAFSIAAQMTSGGNQMMGMGGGAPTSSTLPTLLSTWGVSFESAKVLGDNTHATTFGDRIGVGVLTLPKSSMPQEDNIVTKDLNSITLVLPGAFTKTGGGGVAANTLVKSSTSAGFVDSLPASQLDQDLVTSLRPGGTAYDLVTHLTGTFKTAFPEGKPEPAPPAEGEAAEETPEKTADETPSLKEGTTPGNVFLIADVDAFYDQFAYSAQNFGGMQMVSPVNGNSSLLLNILDQAAGSPHLIGSRSRAATRRPFTVVQEMETQFNKDVGTKIAEIRTKEQEARARLSELQSQKTGGQELYLSPEQEAEIRRLRDEQVDYSRQIRELEKDLRRQKDRLAGNVTLLNVAVMPALIILIGLGFFIKRRSATRAR